MQVRAQALQANVYVKQMLRRCSYLHDAHGWLSITIVTLPRVLNGNTDRWEDCCLNRLTIGNAAHMITMRSLQEKSMLTSGAST